jgi:amino acid permease
MSFPYSYATLGLVPGLILTVVVAGLVLYTSLVLWYVEQKSHIENLI